MVNDVRLRKMRQVLDDRIAGLHCAIESVYHRHNSSAILRTCDALGLHHVHLVGGRFRVARGAARGAERWLELHAHEGPEAALQDLKRRGVSLWVADFADPPTPPEEIPLDRPVCLWFGAELVGVSPIARQAADGVVTLPMRGFPQSLNVSVAAALALRPLADRLYARGDRLDGPTREGVWARWMQQLAALDGGLKARTADDLEEESD
jgi:tRNA (guanosine-2'-O-)-methyltransferase